MDMRTTTLSSNWSIYILFINVVRQKSMLYKCLPACRQGHFEALRAECELRRASFAGGDACEVSNAILARMKFSLTVGGGKQRQTAARLKRRAIMSRR